MNLDSEHGYPGYEQELDTLNADYGSESFIRSILQVYTKDCPNAIQRLMNAIEGGEMDQAGNAIHSLSNIMGVIGPDASRPLIDGISANLKDGQLVTAARQAQDLETMVKASLLSIKVWLEGLSGDGSLDDKGVRGRT